MYAHYLAAYLHTKTAENALVVWVGVGSEPGSFYTKSGSKFF